MHADGADGGGTGRRQAHGNTRQQHPQRQPDARTHASSVTPVTARVLRGRRQLGAAGERVSRYSLLGGR